MKKNIIAVILLIILTSISYHLFFNKYDYIDMNNNKGYSKKCYIAEETDKRPQGLYCKTKKGYIEVKQFGNRW